MVINAVENGSPDMILVPFDGKFDEKKDGIPPGVHRPPYTSNFSILGICGLTQIPKMVINQVPWAPPWPYFGMYLLTIPLDAPASPKGVIFY